MPKHYLTACAMHKLEASRLQEWIEYHLLVGFEHLYLFDNNDTDDGSAKIVRPYVAAGLVTSIPVRGNYPEQQMRLYEWLFRQQLSVWMAFIDIDEFIFPVLEKDVRTIVRSFERHAGLAMSWRCFGTSGQVAAPRYITGSLICASERSFPNNRHIKTIVRCDRVTQAITPHDFRTLPGTHIVNEKSEPIVGPWMDFTDESIVVNHYLLRSAEDYRMKALRGRGDAGPNHYDARFFAGQDRNEVLEDRLARRFAPEVRRRCEAGRTAAGELSSQ